MTVKELLDILEEWAPQAYAEDFDNVGLLVGNPDNYCSGALITLDSTEEVVEEAIAKKCNVIISFHPIVFSGLKKITGSSYVERVVQKAIENQIAIIALHTRIDNHPNGVSEVLCKQLKLSKTEVLVPKKATLKKLVAYVPESHIASILEALHKAGAGSLENYKDCSFLLEGTGIFTGTAQSNPHIGKQMEKVTVSEIQINVVFEAHLFHRVQKALLDAHPYETVAYEMYQLLNSFSQVGMGRIGELEKEMDQLTF